MKTNNWKCPVCGNEADWQLFYCSDECEKIEMRKQQQ